MEKNTSSKMSCNCNLEIAVAGHYHLRNLPTDNYDRS